MAYQLRGCGGEQPAAEVTTGEWTETARQCLDIDGQAEVTLERTVTTTECTWNYEDRQWVLDTENATTDVETMTEVVEDATCVSQSSLLSQRSQLLLVSLFRRRSQSLHAPELNSP